MEQLYAAYAETLVLLERRHEELLGQLGEVDRRVMLLEAEMEEVMDAMWAIRKHL